MQLNQELEILIPEGFRVLSDEERAQMNFLVDGEGVCLKDEEKHMLISIGWKKVNGFSALLLSAKDIAGDMEKRFRKALETYDYDLEGFLERNVGDRKAEGLRYTYQSQQKDMASESFALKRGETFYYFHVYLRQEEREERLPLWEEFLASAVWKEE